jgi:hypothetical protein
MCKDRMRILELATQIFDLSGPVLHIVEALYADDGEILANTSKEELEAISDILDCFGKASGLVTNLSKT